MYRVTYLTKFVLGMVVVACATGCANDPNPKQTSGTLIGAAAGGLLGSSIGKGSGRLVGVGLGTMLGAMAGNAIGKSMDAQDRQLASQTTFRALESKPDHAVSTWKNPNNQHSGSIVITKTDNFPSQNKVCRDYVHTVVIDGEEQKLHGRACRDVRDPKAAWVSQT